MESRVMVAFGIFCTLLILMVPLFVSV